MKKIGVFALSIIILFGVAIGYVKLYPKDVDFFFIAYDLTMGVPFKLKGIVSKTGPIYSVHNFNCHGFLLDQTQNTPLQRKNHLILTESLEDDLSVPEVTYLTLFVADARFVKKNGIRKIEILKIDRASLITKRQAKFFNVSEKCFRGFSLS